MVLRRSCFRLIRDIVEILKILAPLFRASRYLLRMTRLTKSNPPRPPPPAVPCYEKIATKKLLSDGRTQMYNAMFAGFDTTSVTLCRVLECLATEESKASDSLIVLGNVLARGTRFFG